MRVRYDEERLAFLRGAVPGGSVREVTEAFNARFGTQATMRSVRAACSYHEIRGFVNSGRFKSGVPAPNKGKTWDDMFTPEQQERMREQMFKPGNVPAKGRRVPVGSEREDKDGYLWVKVCESKRDPKAKGRKSNRCWRLKHHLAWERANGEGIPEGCFVVFADGDKRNFDPANLVCMTHGEFNMVNNADAPRFYDAESLKACSALAKLKKAVRGS